jgi:hypothetical protein
MDTSFAKDIKFNCDVSDAKYWGYYSVCGLLMRYRDLYRSEMGLKPWSDINRSDITSWIEKKEAKWPELEQKEFINLKIGVTTYHPFDVPAINKALAEHRLVYGAGYGMYMKPSFFLAELRTTRELSGLTVHTSGNELVRDLFTAPGMLQDKTVFLRLEPLTMLLLYKYSELNTKRITALEDAFASYGLRHRQIIDDTFVKKMEEMTGQYAEVLLLHEIAEAAEEVPEWKDILALSGDRQVEHYLRAVKDLIADTSDHGPYKMIVTTRDQGALGLSIAIMEGYRLLLFPEIKKAYAEFTLRRDWSIIEQARTSGCDRFRRMRDAIVTLYGARGTADDFAGRVKAMIPKS